MEFLSVDFLSVDFLSADFLSVDFFVHGVFVHGIHGNHGTFLLISDFYGKHGEMTCSVIG